MTTDTQNEVGTRTIILDGKEVTIPADSRVLRMIENIEAEERAKQFADDRELVRDSVDKVGREQASGYEEAMKGMSIIIDFDAESAMLVPSNLVEIRQRPRRKTS